MVDDGHTSISIPAVREEPFARLDRWTRYIGHACVLGGAGAWICHAVLSLVLFALGRPKPPQTLFVCGLALFLLLVPAAFLVPWLQRIVRALSTGRLVIQWSPTHVRAWFGRRSRAFEIKLDDIDRFETWAGYVTIVQRDGHRHRFPMMIESETAAKLVERLERMLDDARTDARIRIAEQSDYRGHEAAIVDTQTDTADSSSSDKSERR